MKDVRPNVRFVWLQNFSYHSEKCKSNQSDRWQGAFLAQPLDCCIRSDICLRDKGVRGDVTVKSKAAGDHPVQLFTKPSAG